MSSSGASKSEINQDFSNITPVEEFKYPNQASKMIWQVNSNNILQISSQIIELIKANKINIEMAFYLIDVFSEIREKDIKLFAELYQTISNAFSRIIKPENNKFTDLLCYKGIKFEKYEPYLEEEDKILNFYETDSPLYYMAWDKIDELKRKFPNLDVNDKTDLITSFDCAIKFGSELCYNYMKNKGGRYTENSAKYAAEGGNIAIFEQMIEDGQSFDDTIDTALIYRNYEIANYLHTNYN
ncbi:hypothetical protein TVAG_444110 [Trichomonas vaginalis G3]|uniref:DUF3447 domain-containing protein n=1 Tax=Trichomonas vaginalis (strain ATCC PRA-98 / G3) TaxID=412133 RepID=A2E2F3_TRIV3|nr:protein ubiquitination [Trichomonas vaginalis G3]EAY13128.1 hypothetical protein TVAG_444110 [Trichomonas vaginalis G3]KAI5528230.1 protein ubiquitination [Trichomonas vaginalis G3]|eukprot:XP_001325351.1 hypothetical protein [Trichomonas vaginalis G3]